MPPSELYSREFIYSTVYKYVNLLGFKTWLGDIEALKKILKKLSAEY
jgi:hypothetical protein